MIFDGKAFAREIEERVKAKVAGMVRKPKVVSVMVGDDPASVLYTKLKKAAAERVGIQFDVVKLDVRLQTLDIRKTIEKFGNREDVRGVMVQLPLPDELRGETIKCLEAILLAKDVDGLRWEESHVMPATVRAVLAILDKISLTSNIWNLTSKFVVVGARGMVGRPLVAELKKQGVNVDEVEWDSPDPIDLVAQGDVVISCTGKAGIVTGEMVREGAVVIDVGSPKGDMTSEVYQKSSVAVAAPGGVGPVTIACLLQNATDLL